MGMHGMQRRARLIRRSQCAGTGPALAIRRTIGSECLLQALLLKRTRQCCRRQQRQRWPVLMHGTLAWCMQRVLHRVSSCGRRTRGTCCGICHLAALPRLANVVSRGR